MILRALACQAISRISDGSQDRAVLAPVIVSESGMTYCMVTVCFFKS